MSNFQRLLLDVWPWEHMPIAQLIFVLKHHPTTKSSCRDWAAEPGAPQRCIWGLKLRVETHLNVPPIADGDVHRPTVVQLEVKHRVAALVGVHMACTVLPESYHCFVHQDCL